MAKKTIGIVGAGCSSLASEALKHLKCTDVPLASTLHSFQSEALREAYSGLDLTPKGIAPLDQIEAFKDALLSSKILPFKKVKRIAPNKSGHYYLRKLSRSERKRYLKNFKLGLPNIPIVMWLFSECLDTQDFLASAFNWHQSPEGYDYWEKLEARLGYVEQLQKL